MLGYKSKQQSLWSPKS